MKTRHFFNTNGLTAPEAADATRKAKTQNETVLYILRERLGGVGSAWAIHACDLLANTPITSVRRSLSVLTRQGKLVKLAGTVKGQYGKPEHLYQLTYFDGNAI